MIFLKIAWRNVLRHRRRSSLVVITIIFGLSFSIFMRAMMDGVWEKMIEEGIRLNTGYLQVYKKGFWDNLTLEYTFKSRDALEKIEINRPSQVEGITKRLEGSGLLSLGKDTVGSFIVGIQPEAEKEFTSLQDNLTEGSWFSRDSFREALLSKGLVERLGAGVGDEVALLTQDYYGGLGANLYKVRGIFETGRPELDASTIFIDFENAQGLMAAEGRASRLLIWIDRLDNLEVVKEDLENFLPPGQYEVLSWDKIIPEVLQLIAFNRNGVNILLFMLLIVALTAVFNTIFTSVIERVREFGMMFALGARPRQIAGLILGETTILTGIGVFIGSLVGGASSLYYASRPVAFFGYSKGWQAIGLPSAFYCNLTAENVIFLSGAVMFMGFLGAIYPVWVALKSKPVEMLQFI